MKCPQLGMISPIQLTNLETPSQTCQEVSPLNICRPCQADSVNHHSQGSRNLNTEMLQTSALGPPLQLQLQVLRFSFRLRKYSSATLEL